MLRDIDRRTLHVAVPAIVTNITVPLLGLVDMTIVGHMGEAAYIGAIAVGTMTFNMIYWVFYFLRMGTGGMTAQCCGRDDLRGATFMAERSLAVALAVGAALIALQAPLRTLSMTVMHPAPAIRAYAETYFNICVWGAPAVLGLYGLTGWYIGMQDTRVPMAVSITQNIVNIVLSILFVYAMGMKVEGVAYGTVIAQYAGFLLSLTMMRARYGMLARYVSAAALRDRAAMARFFSVNRDIFIRTLFIVGVNVAFTAVGARRGALILAANTVLMQFFTLYSYVMDGFAYAGEAVGGMCFGARDGAALAETRQRLFRYGAILTVVYTAVYAAGGGLFVRLLTDDAAVIGTALTYVPWAAAIPVAGMAAFLYDGLYAGMTATRPMLLSTCTAAVAFAAVTAILSPALDNHALWLALIVFLAVRGLVLHVLHPRAERHVNR